MDPTRFSAPQFGTPQREPGIKGAFWYFRPELIPRALSLEPATILALSEADAALGHLSGLGHLVKDPELLLGPYLTREAVASSAIEGTETSLSEVLQAEVSETRPSNEDVAEVENYVAATRLGIERIKTLPVTQRLIKEVHAKLLDHYSSGITVRCTAVT